MRVLLTATSYPRSEQDWQGIFIRRMCDALARAPSVQLRVWAPEGPLHPRARSALSASDSRFLGALSEAGGMAHLLRSRPVLAALRSLELLTRMRRARRREEPQTDVLHLNWLQCALATGGTRLPMLVTVLGTDLSLLGKPWMRVLLRRALRGHRAVICPNAQWMVPVLQSALGGITPDIRYVPFGLDPHWYAVERSPASTPREWITVLRVTDRKIGKLFAWTRDVDPQAHRFHLFGPLQETLQIPPWIEYHGATTPEELASRWYPRASGMISLSEHDEGRPQVLLEAMAAGVPVVCSRIPAHVDLLQSLETGALVSSREEFLSVLERAEEQNPLAIRGRSRVMAEFGTWDDCAARYGRIYADLVAQRSAACGS